MSLYDKICINCGKPFVAKHALTQYCSYNCKKQSWNHTRKEKRKQYLLNRTAVCSVCGKTFSVPYTGKSGRAPSTCSDECRQLLKERREQNQAKQKHKHGPTLMDRYAEARKRGETNLSYGYWVVEQEKKEAEHEQAAI